MKSNIQKHSLNKVIETSILKFGHRSQYYICNILTLFGKLFFADGVAGKAYSELLEDFAVNFAEHHRRMNLAALKLRKLGKGATAVFIAGGNDGEGHEDFISMQARFLTAEIVNLGELNRLDHLLRNELDTMVYYGKMLDGIEDERGAGT